MMHFISEWTIPVIIVFVIVPVIITFFRMTMGQEGKSNLKHPYVRKFALKLADKAKGKLEGDQLRAMMFQIAGIYGCTELYGLWATCKMMYHLMIKPMFARGRK